MAADDDDPPIRVPLGRHDELVLNYRYEVLSIANDLLIAVFFLVGSVMFYFKSIESLAITMFVLGSIDFLLRPIIRLARRTHLKRLGHRSDAASYDY